MWAAVVKAGRLTGRDYSQKLPVDLLLFFTNRLDKHRGEPWNPERNATAELGRITENLILLMSHLLCCAAGPGSLYAARWRAVCRTLHHFDGKGFLIHAGAGAVACTKTTTQTKYKIAAWISISSSSKTSLTDNNPNIFFYFKVKIKRYLGVPCGLRFRGLPRRGEGWHLGVMVGGKLIECPFVFGTSRRVELIHTCRLQTFDPIMDFSLRNHSKI